jgi:hypothetical protein
MPFEGRKPQKGRIARRRTRRSREEIKVPATQRMMRRSTKVI